MTLAERAKTPPDLKGPGIACSVGALLTDLDKTEAKALQTLLDAPWRIWPHSEVEKALEAEGYRVGVGQVGKHRRGSCRCNREPR